LNSSDDLPPNLIIDIDDTCVDTLTAFVKWLANLDRLSNVSSEKISNRENLGSWLGVSDEHANLWLKEFTEYSWQWGATLPCLGAEKVLSRIKQQGWHIIAFSRASKDMHRAILRRANLELLFPGIFNDVYVVQKDDNFYPILKNYDYSVVVTALESTAISSAQAGHATFLMNQPWNHEFSDIRIRKFKNWLDIETALERYLK
jgi:hypothetical protein